MCARVCARARACACVPLRVCWPAATACEKKHHEVDLSL